MAEEVDLMNRDPNNLHGEVNVTFESIIGEPDAFHSIDCVWRNAACCYNGGKNCCYKFLTVLCGLPAALCWGCKFACIAFNYIWCMVPCMRCCELCISCCRVRYQLLLSCCLAPLFETLSLCCSRCGIFGWSGVDTSKPPPLVNTKPSA